MANDAYINSNLQKVAALGLVDVVNGERIIHNTELKLVFVDDQEEAEAVKEKYTAPTIFVTHDLASMWNLKPDMELAAIE